MSNDEGIFVEVEQGRLTLTCREYAFHRLKAIVLAETPFAENASSPIGTILIRKAPPAVQIAPWQDRIADLGCAVVGLMVLFMLMVGAYTISSWFW